MHIILAPNAFKESLTAKKAIEVMSETIKANYPNFSIDGYPLADGGDGFLQSVKEICEGKTIECKIFEPIQNINITSSYFVLNDNTVIVEMSLASGLALIPIQKRNALSASSYGVGQLVKDAINKGYRKFVIGLGGSSCTDGGTGMAQALGFEFFNSETTLLPLGPSPLLDYRTISSDNVLSDLKECSFTIASDVTNPLLGSKGSATIFGPQKGATESEVKLLEEALTTWSITTQQLLNLKEKLHNVPGTGAAGGLGFFLHTFLKGDIISGANWIIKQSGIEKQIHNANIIITTEGTLDFQSADGKIIQSICKLGKKHNKPVVVITGILGEGWDTLKEYGLTSAFALAPGPTSLEKSIANTIPWLQQSTNEIIATFLAGKSS